MVSVEKSEVTSINRNRPAGTPQHSLYMLKERKGTYEETAYALASPTHRYFSHHNRYGIESISEYGTRSTDNDKPAHT